MLIKTASHCDLKEIWNTWISVEFPIDLKLALNNRTNSTLLLEYLKNSIVGNSFLEYNLVDQIIWFELDVDAVDFKLRFS